MIKEHDLDYGQSLDIRQDNLRMIKKYEYFVKENSKVGLSFDSGISKRLRDQTKLFWVSSMCDSLLVRPILLYILKPYIL